MRTVQLTPECKKYIENHSREIEKKFNYCLQILIEQKVVHTKLVKKLVKTDFYELRISTRNEHRIIIFAVDNESFTEAKQVISSEWIFKEENQRLQSRNKNC